MNFAANLSIRFLCFGTMICPSQHKQLTIISSLICFDGLFLVHRHPTGGKIAAEIAVSTEI
jgi:hypothetical protein